jgi:hypothetical protein
MAKTRHTPEEQLLSLIEEGKDFARLKHKRKRTAPLIFGSIGKIRSAPVFIYKLIKSRLSRLKGGTGDASLKPVIHVLITIAIALSGYLIIDFVFGSPDISRLEQRPLRKRQENPEGLDANIGRTFLSYLAMVQRRNVFSPIMIENAQIENEAEKEEIKQTIKELAGTLRLAGIALQPQAQAMIENTETNETLFLKEGDIINKLVVHDILSDRVILMYEGETIELL